MTKGPWDDAVLRTDRFLLRPLAETDVNDRYLGWFSGRGAANISSHPASLADLRAYVRARRNRPDVLFLAILHADMGDHLGNLKFEPVDLDRGEAVLGIFIGEPSWQGKGVASEIIPAAAGWLHANRGLRRISLGVATGNDAARRAYAKVGFVPENSPLIPDLPDVLAMALHLPQHFRAGVT